MKYKQCCSKILDATGILKARLHRTENEFANAALDYIDTQYGFDLILDAWEDFLGREEPPIFLEDDYPNGALFRNWLLYSWVPDQEDWPERNEDYLGIPLAVEHLLASGEDPESFTGRIVFATCRTPFSFYRILEVEPSTSLLMEDIFRRSEVNVNEGQGAEPSAKGGLMFARLVEIDGITMLMGCGGLIIPPAHTLGIIKVRKDISTKSGKVSLRRLLSYQVLLLRYYQKLTDLILNPPSPQMTNLDGEAMVPTTLYYNLSCSVQAAFDRLKDLDNRSESELLADGEKDAQGTLERICCSWSRPGKHADKMLDHTVLADFSIRGSKLTVQVNSTGRADRAKEEVEKRLGKDARFRRAAMDSIEKMFKKGRDLTPQPIGEAQKVERIVEVPHEIRVALNKKMDQYWEDWLDMKIPALEDKTPHQAARSKVGRELLEALLDDIAWSGRRDPDPVNTPDVKLLRKKLGL